MSEVNIETLLNKNSLSSLFYDFVKSHMLGDHIYCSIRFSHGKSLASILNTTLSCKHVAEKML